MPTKPKSTADSLLWYHHFYNALKDTPINLTLFIVSTFIFYKIVSTTRRRHLRQGNKRNKIEMALPPIRRDLTMQELAAFNGSQEDGRILLAINFNIYDVSKAKHFYGPGGIYPTYAGSDISRNMVNFTVDENIREEFDDLSDLSFGQMVALREWDRQYKEKYPYVGKLVRERVDDEKDQQEEKF